VIHFSLRCQQCSHDLEFSLCEKAAEKGGVKCPECNRAEMILLRYESDNYEVTRQALKELDERISLIEKVIVDNQLPDDFRFVSLKDN
jgi:DNA-directed RNA polymerase subunit RPC12/RpoP